MKPPRPQLTPSDSDRATLPTGSLSAMRIMPVMGSMMGNLKQAAALSVSGRGPPGAVHTQGEWTASRNECTSGPVSRDD